MVDNEGCLSGFEMPNNDLKMNFTNLRITDGAAPPETAASTENTTEKCTETTRAQ
jgi:hypothetical protein